MRYHCGDVLDIGQPTAAAGLKVCCLVDAVSFTASLYAVVRLPAMRPEGGGSVRGPRAVVDGLRFIGRHTPLLGALVWGASLIGFGLVGGLAPTLARLVVAGIADVLSVVFRAALVQTATPIATPAGSARRSTSSASEPSSWATSAAACWGR